VRALIAEDDRLTAAMLAGALRRWGFDATVVHDGQAAWDVIRADAPPPLAVIDWMMPGIDGVELCRRVRSLPARAAMYLLLLTVRDGREDVVAGLDAGADDYLVKPFDTEELRARIQAGARIVSLRDQLAEQITKLEEALRSVRQLKGLLPMCTYCKRVRTDGDYWQQLESYLSDHTGAQVSHGICPECLSEVEQQYPV
jgi:DNA-binding response OmpR family regulator